MNHNGHAQRHMQLWGGTPGHETFLVPYNVTTKDW